MIYRIFLFLVLVLTFNVAYGQETTGIDTTIYQIVEESPRFPGCEKIDTTLVVKNECAQRSLLGFVYQNVVYPLEARQNGKEGTVVASFVVEPDSTISSPKILRDIGGGAGAEVLKILNAMNEIGVRWSPGKKSGKAVRTQFNLPVKFKLEEVPPYIMIGQDSVYTSFETVLAYKEGTQALIDFLDEKLVYPAGGNDSCAIGSMSAQLLVQPNNKVRILDLNDFNNLGFDFQFEAINAITSTIGKWTPATYEGRPVPAAYDINLTFLPTEKEKCKMEIDKYAQANQVLQEGAQLYDEEKVEEGLAKMTEAVLLFPDNAEFLYIRGQAYLELNRMAEACADLSRVKEILSVNWYDSLLPIICQ